MALTPAQEMLCLAALTYRDFADAGPPSSHHERLRLDIASKLATLAPLEKQWALVWGPSSYRAPLSLFDDAAMFVVQHTENPDRYVVAIRGTNPISAFDWLFGDLWVSGQMDWPFDTKKEARISLSTALGLDILLQLRSSAPPKGAAKVWTDFEKKLGGIGKAFADHLIQPSTNAAVVPARDRLQKALANLAALRVGMQSRGSAARVDMLLKQWCPAIREPLIDAAAAGLSSLGGEPSVQMLALFQKHASLVAGLPSGHDLLSFLKAAVASREHDKVEITFTGHSKGGALAPTLALWFAENQGPVREAFRWDPDKRAAIACYHFAGPTAGNAAFAARSNAKIGDRCFRIYNPLDVVPKGWVPDDMRKIGDLYDPKEVLPIPGFDSLVDQIADIVDQQDLGYTHLGNKVEKLTSTVLEPDTHDFIGQLIHQHLQAYLDAMEIGAFVSVDSLFNPLR